MWPAHAPGAAQSAHGAAIAVVHVPGVEARHAEIDVAADAGKAEPVLDA